jgi:hypothetical protein
MNVLDILYDNISQLHMMKAPPFVSCEDKTPGVGYKEIETCLGLAQKGDVALTHHVGYLSNVIIPGFWKHAFLVTDNTGFSETVEATHIGVHYNTGMESFAADYAVLLRPKVEMSDCLVAIDRIKTLIGLPYDRAFQFDIERETKYLTETDAQVLDAARKDLNEAAKRKSYHPAFSCSETVAYAYWLVREKLGIKRSVIHGKQVILPNDFWTWNTTFELVWASDSTKKKFNS